MPALYVEDEQAYQLVKELADRQGKTIAEAVIEVTQEKLDQLRAAEAEEAFVQYWLDVGRSLRAAEDPATLGTDPTARLYDAHGLPR